MPPSVERDELGLKLQDSPYWNLAKNEARVGRLPPEPALLPTPPVPSSQPVSSCHTVDNLVILAKSGGNDLATEDPSSPLPPVQNPQLGAQRSAPLPPTCSTPSAPCFLSHSPPTTSPSSTDRALPATHNAQRLLTHPQAPLNPLPRDPPPSSCPTGRITPSACRVAPPPRSLPAYRSPLPLLPPATKTTTQPQDKGKNVLVASNSNLGPTPTFLPILPPLSPTVSDPMFSSAQPKSQLKAPSLSLAHFEIKDLGLHHNNQLPPQPKKTPHSAACSQPIAFTLTTISPASTDSSGLPTPTTEISPSATTTAVNPRRSTRSAKPNRSLQGFHVGLKKRQRNSPLAASKKAIQAAISEAGLSRSLGSLPSLSP